MIIKLAGSTTQGPCSAFTMSANNRLKYTGTTPYYFVVQAQLSWQTNLMGTGHIRIAKNGVTDASTDMQTLFTSTGIDTLISTSGIVYLLQNDYIEIWVTRSTPGRITGTSMEVTVHSLK